MERITVVIPTYNHGRFVLETLDSVFAQSRPADEVIVVNDGSPDDTAEVLRPLVEAEQIRYIEQPNAGQGAARNRGWRAATGDLIAMLDDDDLWPADKLERQAGLLEADPEAVLVYGDHTLALPDGERRRESIGGPTGHVYDAFRLRNWVLSLGQTLIRRSALEAVGGLDESIWGADDWDLLLKLARQGRFIYDPHMALIYRLHGDNASRQAIRHAQAHLKVATKHLGLNLPLWRAHRREAGRYFVPNLCRLADRAADEGDPREAARACTWALAFHFSPRLAARATGHLLEALRGSRASQPAATGGRP